MRVFHRRHLFWLALLIAVGAVMLLSPSPGPSTPPPPAPRAPAPNEPKPGFIDAPRVTLRLNIFGPYTVSGVTLGNAAPSGTHLILTAKLADAPEASTPRRLVLTNVVVPRDARLADGADPGAAAVALVTRVVADAAVFLEWYRPAERDTDDHVWAYIRRPGAPVDSRRHADYGMVNEALLEAGLARHVSDRDDIYNAIIVLTEDRAKKLGRGIFAAGASLGDPVEPDGTDEPDEPPSDNQPGGGS